MTADALRAAAAQCARLRRRRRRVSAAALRWAAAARGSGLDRGRGRRIVKWFKGDKGYGFVELANGQGDAFLHANALQRLRPRERVPTGAKLKVLVGAGAKGAQVTRVLEVDTSTAVTERPQRSVVLRRRAASARAAPRPIRRPRSRSPARSSGSTTPRASASSPAKTAARTCSSIFPILGPAGISHLAEGQQVKMRVVDTPKGREAISLSL